MQGKSLLHQGSRKTASKLTSVLAHRIIPPVRSSVFSEDSFSLKRFQSDGEIAGF
jgi:hypothetical protein